MKLKIPTFAEKSELIDFLIKHKEELIAQKKGAIKYADAFALEPVFSKDVEGKEEIIKNDGETLLNKDEFTVKAVINTTNVMDSHNDVHLNGIWSKTLKENKMIMHVQEHKSNEFKAIISSGEDLKAYTRTMAWKDLGVDAEGSTQALMFRSKVKKERNPYMHEQYAKGQVKNHSVGMRYVKIKLAVNDERYEEEYAEWEKHIDKILNKEHAEQKGYFYPVYEAKAIEGSAVPLGSNWITPTLSAKSEPSEDTQDDEAAKALQKRKNYLINL